MSALGHTHAVREQLTYQGRTYNLIYHFHFVYSSPEAEAQPTSQHQQVTSGGVGRLGSSAEIMMDAALDFPTTAHHLERWFVVVMSCEVVWCMTCFVCTWHMTSEIYQVLWVADKIVYIRFGYRDFVMLAPISENGCSESESNLLLSTLSIVVQDCKS